MRKPDKETFSEYKHKLVNECLDEKREGIKTVYDKKITAQ